MEHFYILAINPGSTSTKIGVYEDERELFAETIEHSKEELAKSFELQSDFEMRRAHIFEILDKHGFDVKKLSAAVGRGGHGCRVCRKRPVRHGVCDERYNERNIRPCYDGFSQNDRHLARADAFAPFSRAGRRGRGLGGFYILHFAEDDTVFLDSGAHDYLPAA